MQKYSLRGTVPVPEPEIQFAGQSTRTRNTVCGEQNVSARFNK